MTKPVTLVEAIRLAGLTQREVADMADVHESIVSRACRGESFPSLDTAIAIAQALKVPVESINWSRTRNVP